MLILTQLRGKLWHHPYIVVINFKLCVKIMRDVIQKVAVGPDRGRDMSREEAFSTMEHILSGEADEIQVAVLLIALRMKRESLDEFLGLFDAMQSSVKTVEADVSELFCLADPFDGYVRTATMTPFIPAVLAANDCPALMHGVETVGPKHGVTANKVYAKAGIDVNLTSADAAQKVKEAGWVYVDQAQYAPSLYALNDLRDRIVKRTALTTLERLLMPIKAKKTHFVLGYVHKAYPSIYASVAAAAGYDSTLLLKGVEGGLAPALNKPLRRFFIEGDLPEDVDQEKELLESIELFNAPSAAQALSCVSDFDDKKAVDECLSIGLDVMSGKSCQARDSLSLAAGQILYAHRKADSLSDAIDKVNACLDDGRALARFNALI